MCSCEKPENILLLGAHPGPNAQRNKRLSIGLVIKSDLLIS